ncbi:PhoH family protein [Acetobacteraceae bacterium ESL0709]|nr:PhoH family protein [Acetobacteraceae bacterium ESL0697]MDF7678220.1 PhoH family protein [Acetobacteraceae bacterium ESL0709]
MTAFSPKPARSDSHPSKEKRSITLRFENNTILKRILGEYDRHLVQLEQGLDVRLVCRGNRIAITGTNETVSQAQSAFEALHHLAEKDNAIDAEQVMGVIRLVSMPTQRLSRPEKPSGPDLRTLPAFQTKRGVITPRSPGQADYMKELADKELVFGLGPAGTGKTYLAVAQAVSLFLSGKVERIILSRPAVEAGERLGFLPGDMREKIDPYLRPLYDALHDMMPGDQIARRMAAGEIEVAPLAFMRGRTLAHAYVILDEAQNTTPAQMKMFLTRMGNGTHMTITGDLSQIDLPPSITSGLKEAVSTLENVPGIGFCHLSSADVIRHPLVARIIDAYDQATPLSPHNSFSRAYHGAPKSPVKR